MKATVTPTTARRSSGCSTTRWSGRGHGRATSNRRTAMPNRITVLTGIALALTAAAGAQDNAVKSAADAFGERVGTEQSGLYSETQVRGFDLNDSGAYRIDDAYFSRAAAMNDPV